MPDMKRPHHQRVLTLLNALSAELLQSTACFFGGGTRIVLELNEYRESLDVDFLCADQNGYRELRNHVTNRSLGGIFSKPPTLLRDVRADMYGIRTFVEIEEQPVKFEIIREARINLTGVSVGKLPVPCLSHSSAIAEKFLANADRGLDKSTRSRDLVDLAFMVASWSEDDVNSGLELAQRAYGDVVLTLLRSALELFDDDSYRMQCLTELEVGRKKTLETGMGLLAEMVKN